MAKLKNPEINSILFDKEEQEKIESEQAWEEYLESQRGYEEELNRRKEEEYEQKIKAMQEKNETILSLDPNYEEKLEGDRRGIFYDDHRNVDNEHHINVYEERPQDAYVGELTDTVYLDGSSSTYWGAGTDIPAHWNNKQAENYLEMRANGYKVSEKMFDNYIKSDAKDFDTFLNIERVRCKINKNVKKAEKSPELNNSIASIAVIKHLKGKQKG